MLKRLEITQCSQILKLLPLSVYFTGFYQASEVDWPCLVSNQWKRSIGRQESLTFTLYAKSAICFVAAERSLCHLYCDFVCLFYKLSINSETLWTLFIIEAYLCNLIVLPARQYNFDKTVLYHYNVGITIIVIRPTLFGLLNET